MFGWNTTAPTAQYDMMERSGAYNGVASFAGHGLVSGTRVASNLGWRPVEAIAAGDMVLTFDNGMQKVTDVKRTSFWSDAYNVPAHMLPVVVPAGALGNRSALKLMPEQGVMVESDAAMDAYGDPFAVVSATALEGFRGIFRAKQGQQMEIITLTFEDPQVIYADGGALVFCPQAQVSLNDMLDVTGTEYDMLEGQEAAFLIECMKYEDLALPAAACAA